MKEYEQKMQEFRELYKDMDHKDLMLLFEVVIELICKDKSFMDDLKDHPNSHYVLYGILKKRMNSVMYHSLFPEQQRMSKEEFLKSIDGADGSHIRRY